MLILKKYLCKILIQQKNIAIFPGFITPARVAHYGDILDLRYPKASKLDA